MVTPNLWCLMACVLLMIGPSATFGQTVSLEQAQKSASAGFRPAVFHGLKMGKAKRADVLQAFGKPEWEGLGEDGAHWMAYRDVDGIQGLTQFVLDAKTLVVETVTIDPRKMSIVQLKQMLGQDYAVTRWTFSTCDGDTGMARLFLDPNGDGIFMEYRKLGISVQTRGFNVEEINYQSVPIGLDRDPCQPKPRRSKAKREP